MLYLDTSSFLKLLLPETDSARVEKAIAAEAEVVISSLVELETVVQIRAAQLGGKLTKTRARRVLDHMGAFKRMEPFRFVPLPGSVFGTATRQRQGAQGAHCRTLDHLHLAAMEELGIKRLMTHDTRQAVAAAELGFQVVAG